jgi:hypothetical protein
MVPAWAGGTRQFLERLAAWWLRYSAGMTITGACRR